MIMPNVLDTLRERGFLQQITFEDELCKLLENESVTFYIGFDPTADSLHIGHYIPVMAMAHMQRAGHRPIALMGAGTAMVGDPSGKTDMRRMLSFADIDANSRKIKVQFERFLDFKDGRAIMDNNADWLMKLNYVDFLRDVGVHFSVNKMLTADCYRLRMEKGLSFLEFNYMLMQSYDFLVLHNKYGCKLQMGGDDQWSNMLSGADLIRRKEGKPAFVCTFALLQTSDGRKMGKTESGALWLSPERTSPYDFYQYWRNVEDSGVKNALSMLTFLPMDEVRRLASFTGERINEAKKALAFEVTRLIHGEEEANKARAAAEALFGAGEDSAGMPTTRLTRAQLEAAGRVAEVMLACGLTSSNGEGMRLIREGAVSVDDRKVTDAGERIDLSKINGNSFVIKKGKKSFHRVIVED
jgi:tyrosyl-tRNA synthetase